jgi:class 3 adenylate cyclase/ActR/RegA family two-component response regulator
VSANPTPNDADIVSQTAALDALPSASILVVDDDPIILDYIRLHLATADFDVRIALSVAEAMTAIADAVPDLILSDISMPNVDGFDFLARLRADPVTEKIPFIFLTQHNDIDVMRRGMQLGANDFLSKPIRRAELLNAISGRIKILEGLRQAASKEAVPTLNLPVMDRMIEQASASLRPRNHTEPIRAIGGTVALNAAQRTVDGTVLFSDIRGFSSIAEKLNANEVAELLNAYFNTACEPILAQRGWVVKFVGDGVVAMFDNEATDISHQARALKSALLITVAASQFQAWIDQRFPNRNLPRFAIGVGLHCGEISIASMGQGSNQETTVLGDVVNIASRLESMSKELGWSVVASGEVVFAGGDRFVLGRSGQVNIKGREAMADIFEVSALLPREDDLIIKGASSVYDRIAEAVASNTALVASLQPDTSNTTQGMQITARRTVIRLDGYRLLRKLGEGGMSTVYLAENIANGEQQVLKLIKMSAQDDGEMVQRFIGEFALISQIDHPNVAKIFAQGFSESHAYIAMEYFPGGDLRQLMSGEFGETLAIATLLQVAGALSAIHGQGIVHRDMKPDNIMIRADGSLALADFGIATQIETDLHPEQAGEVYGTPSYLSPEQATDSAVDHRADIYALGVMFFEMLTGKKPYRAASPQALLYQHVNADVPRLSADYAHYQNLLEKLMAKDPAHRFSQADEIIDAVLAISPPNL